MKDLNNLPALLDAEPQDATESTPDTDYLFLKSNFHRNFGLTVLAVLVLVIGGWLFFAEIDGAVITQGELRGKDNRYYVQHELGGVIEKLNVDNGSIVEKGDVLIELDNTNFQADLTVIQDELYELEGRQARLFAFIKGSEDIQFPQKLVIASEDNAKVASLIDSNLEHHRYALNLRKHTIAKLNQRAKDTLLQIKSKENQREALNKYVSLINEDLRIQHVLLKKKFSSRSDIVTLQREAANLQSQISAINADLTSLNSTRISALMEVNRFASDEKEKASVKLQGISVRIKELSARELELVREIDSNFIKAPVSGVVHNIVINNRGAVIQAAQVILSIVPEDERLIADVHLQLVDIDRVFIGQDVSLLFTALNSKTTPEIRGDVVSISADRIVGDDGLNSFYLAEIRFTEQEKEKLGVMKDRLMPGMPIEAHINTGLRSPISYLLKPFNDQLRRALKEE